MSPRRLAELLALAAGAAVWLYVGWDSALWDARYQLALHLAAAAAIAGLAALALLGARLPRTRVDLPILLLLGAFGLATLSAWNPGLSARALAAIVATAAMLPVALVALRHRPGWTALLVTLPIIGLSAGTLAVMGWRRLEWFLVGAPGLPPVRLANEGTPFGSVAVPPFVILAALPVALLIPWRGARLAALLGLLAVGVPLALLSGSRSAWLATAVAVAVLAGGRLLRGVPRPRLPRRMGGARLALVVAGAAAAGVALAYISGRLTDLGSLVYRVALWRDTLAAWSTDPWLGIGPGAMPWARQAAAEPLSFPVRQPHSHDIPLGVLGDAGIVGLAALATLVVAFVVVAGPWRQRSLVGRAAFAVLAGLAAGSLFEDLTFLPNYNLELVLLAAIALREAGAVEWRPVAARARAWLPAAVGAAALAAVMVVGDAAAVAYRLGIDAAGNGQWPAAQAWLQRAVALDPRHPTGPKSLAVAAERAGNPELALAMARRAVALNPGDALSWTNVALLCRDAGDRACAGEAAARAVEYAAVGGRELANAALVYEWLGQADVADAAYRRSLLTNRWTGLTLPWPRQVEVTDALVDDVGFQVAELHLLLGRRIFDQPIDPSAYADPGVHLLALAMVGERDAALAAAEAIIDAPVSGVNWELVALVRRHYGLDPGYELAVAAVIRGRPLPEEGPIGAPALIFDIAAFRGYPADGLVSSAERLLPDTPWPWVVEPLLAPAGG